jgi:hypothetical protein
MSEQTEDRNFGICEVVDEDSEIYPDFLKQTADVFSGGGTHG